MTRSHGLARLGHAILGAWIGVLAPMSAPSPGAAQAPTQPAEIKRPAYQVLRFDEDWSVLRGVDLTKTGDFWDRLKFIPLTSSMRRFSTRSEGGSAVMPTCEVGRSRWQVEPGFLRSPLSTEGR